jgi:hypothetical protein
MDIFGYRDTWYDKDAPVADRRIDCLHLVWKNQDGYHPTSIKSRVFFDTALRQQIAKLSSRIPYDQKPSPVGDVFGHNLMTDDTNTSLTRAGSEIPIAPLYARDLTGRMIYLGVGPHHKMQEEWGCDRQVAYPRYCSDLHTDIVGIELIEQVFLTKFRCLDMSRSMSGALTVNPSEPVAGFYPNQNLYPYKVRLDTFYIDGWKLPQMEAVYARTEGVTIQQAESATNDLLAAWQKRPHNQSYEEFYDAIGGAEYFDSLFVQGCTLIPTFEACNGYHKLSRQFELEDFWPGRAVMGLHEVVQRKPDAAPEGTILQVLEPGIVMGHRIHPAKVVVSDGSGYTSPHYIDPDPLFPDIRLPHQRAVAKWKECWLPTHPKHFERPAIWGWDTKTGIFMQLKGPLWDPLHYFYGSVDEVLKAYKGPALEGNKWLIPVPEKMKTRFYPIVPMRGFDTINVTYRDEVEEKLIRPFTSCMRFDDGKYSCNIGYHPLPVQYEYELDNWWFPELDPRQRTTAEVPLDVESRLCPVIECPILPEAYLSTVIAPPEAPWLKDATIMKSGTGNSLEDYGSIKRYIGPFSEKALRENALVYLEAPAGDEMDISTRELASRFVVPPVLEEKFPAYAQALLELAEEAAKRYQFRHQSFRQDPGGYIRDWWMGVMPIVRPVGSAKQTVYKPSAQAPKTNNALPTAEEQVRHRGISAAALKGPVVIE